MSTKVRCPNRLITGAQKVTSKASFDFIEASGAEPARTIIKNSPSLRNIPTRLRKSHYRIVRRGAIPFWCRTVAATFPRTKPRDSGIGDNPVFLTKSLTGVNLSTSRLARPGPNFSLLQPHKPDIRSLFALNRRLLAKYVAPLIYSCSPADKRFTNPRKISLPQLSREIREFPHPWYKREGFRCL